MTIKIIRVARHFVAALLLVAALSLAAPAAHAIKVDDTTGGGGGGGGSTGATPSTTSSGDDIADPAASQDCTEDGGSGRCDFVATYINPTITLLSILVGIVAVIAIIFGAIQVTSSAGDPQKSANGKGHIRNALIGLVAYVVLLAFLNWLVPGGIR